jgi:hypothetical protein
MSSLPQPPVLHPAASSEGSSAPLVAGQLTQGWKVVFGIGWCGVLLGFAAVAKTARTIGLSTWWLGASADPRFFIIQALPFVPGVLLVIAALRGARYLPYYGLLGALSLAAIAAGDIGRFDRLALVEFAIAAAGGAVSAAAFAGLVRRASSEATN